MQDQFLQIWKKQTTKIIKKALKLWNKKHYLKYRGTVTITLTIKTIIYGCAFEKNDFKVFTFSSGILNLEN